MNGPRNNPTDELERGIGAFGLAASAIVIFFVGTFPFDFTFGSGTWQLDFDWRWMEWDPHWVDRSQNIMLFMPFGFALAAVLRPRRWRVVWQLSLALLIGAAFSFSIECLQKFVSFRDPALMDLWTNTLGSLCGAIVYVIMGDLLLNWAARLLLLFRPLGKPWIIAIVLIAYSLFQLIGPTLVRNPGDLSVWDPDLPLIVGNELSADRAWRGTVSEIVLSDRAVDDEQAMHLYHGAAAESIFNDSLLAHYIPRGSGPYEDSTGHLPPLAWVQKTPSGLGTGAPPISSREWLKTPSPVTYASERIMRSSQFTLATWVTPATLDQRGPARLVSISQSINSRNVQLGQEFGDLSIRVRNAVRVMPDMHLHNVFAEDQPLHIIVTAHDSRVVVYLNGQERGNLLVTPEAKMIWRLYPRQGFWTRMEKYGFRSYAAIYRAMVFIPFSALLGAALILSKLTPRTKRTVAIMSVGIMAVALETVLGILGDGFQIINLAISLFIGLAMLDLMAGWRRRRRAAPGSST